MPPIIAVFCGGISREREVSLGSGRAAAEALRRRFPVEVFEINAPELPARLSASRHVVFSTLHGTFGEDGGMQALLEGAGVAFAGCDAYSSRVTFDKDETKRLVSEAGVPVAPGVCFSASRPPFAEDLRGRLGDEVVLKPCREGSSVGLRIVESPERLPEMLGGLEPGIWLAEKRIRGREVTVGLLHGKALGIVEIVPRSGHFDYESKYTKGLTQYLCPAALEAALDARLRQLAEAAFAACSCRDFARIDFMISEAGEPCLLEINTLPGLKETSLLPMAAQCAGLNFEGLCAEMVRPALERQRAARGIVAA